MRTQLKFSALVATLCFGISSTSFAADLDRVVSLPMAPTIKPVEVGNGWYLRGDIGYTANLKSGANSFNTYSAANGYGAGTVASQSYKDHVSGGVGVGYKLNDLLRVDGTLDIIRGNFSGSGAGLEPCVGGPATTTCSYGSSASYSNYMAMANAYIDLGTVSGFTPYVGAGVGLTRVNWGSVTQQGTCVGAACGVTAIATTSHAGQSSWRRTWALMSGVSYDVSDKMKLDLGYRYSRIDGGNSYSYDTTTTTAGALGSQGRDGGLDRHEVRVGLRVSTW